MSNILSGRRVEIFGNEIDENDAYIKQYEATFIDLSRNIDGIPVAVIMTDDGFLKVRSIADVRVMPDADDLVS